MVGDCVPVRALRHAPGNWRKRLIRERVCSMTGGCDQPQLPATTERKALRNIERNLVSHAMLYQVERLIHSLPPCCGAGGRDSERRCDQQVPSVYRSICTEFGESSATQYNFNITIITFQINITAITPATESHGFRRLIVMCKPLGLHRHPSNGGSRDPGTRGCGGMRVWGHGAEPFKEPNTAAQIAQRSVRQREYLTESEVERLLDAARKRGRNAARDSAAILLAYRHGLRAQELCSLRWAQ